jgi:hypothetical protein
VRPGRSTSAKAAIGGTTPCVANDMTTRTTATLECAARVMPVARMTSRSGWVAMAPSSRRTLGTSSKHVDGFAALYARAARDLQGREQRSLAAVGMTTLPNMRTS